MIPLPTINPAEITNWDDAPRFRRTGIVYARPVSESEIGTELVKPRGFRETLQRGDWIIYDKPQGTPLYPMRGADFEEDFEPIPGMEGAFHSTEIVRAHFVDHACRIESPFADSTRDHGFNIEVGQPVIRASMTNDAGQKETIYYTISPEEAMLHGDFHAQYEPLPNPKRTHGAPQIEHARGAAAQIGA